MNTTGDVLFVCSGGGHLRQLAAFADRLGYAHERQVWVTFQNGLSESLLAGRRVIYAPFTGPRDGRHFAKLIPLARKVLAEGHFAEVISTGSSPAVAFLPQAAMRGIPTYYIESAARADGPSLTGKLIARVPRVRTFTQYPAWSSERWEYRGSIFDEYEPGPIAADSTPRRAVVSVGTQEGYPFTRLFEKVVPLLDGFDEVLYQTGDADVSQLGITGVPSLPHDELKQAISDADVVITHAGVGGALTALGLGKYPIMVPRSLAHGEHVDDHQFQVARELDRRGLALMREVVGLTVDDLHQASRRSVGSVTAPPFSFDARTEVTDRT